MNWVQDTGDIDWSIEYLTLTIDWEIYYDDIARDTGFSTSKVYQAAAQLEKEGFIERTHSGYYTAYVPAVAAASEIKEHRERFRKEKRFYQELNKRISKYFKENKVNRDNLPHIHTINALYSQLVSVRQSRRTHNYVPEEEGTAHILPNLIAHTPPDSKLLPVYHRLEEMSYQLS